MVLNIAMDGPVGAGKSSIADAVAKRLGILHLDTGAMYRAIGLTALEKGVPVQDEQAVTALCQALSMTVGHAADGQHTLVDGRDVTGFIRTPEVSMAASTVAKYAGVRAAMVALQRRLAQETPMLVDGRDIGTRVLMNAPVKIFLTASAEERARRRYQEMVNKGMDANFDDVLRDLRARDEQDMHRAVDPLRAAEDAVTVDSTNLTFDEVVEAILRIVADKTGAHGHERAESAGKEEEFPASHGCSGKKGIIYTIARGIFLDLLPPVLLYALHGREKLNLDAPYIVIANHTSFADPIIAAMLIRRYEVNFLGKIELAKAPVVGKLLMRLHMIPVDRHHSDMEAMRACLRVTKAGGVLGIFPEGTRHKEGIMEHVESGVALIALRSGVPMIPLYIGGKPRLFRRLDVRVGDPIAMDDLRERGVNRDTCEELLARITETYRALTAHPEA